MPRHLTIKNIDLEHLTFKNRVVIAMIAMAVLMSIIVARLAWLQIYNHSYYTTLAQGNRFKVLPIAPPRGLIFARDGAILAENRPTFNLEVTLEMISELDELLRSLSELIDFNDADRQRFLAEIKRKRRFETVLLRANLSEVEVARFSVNRHRFPGVNIVASLMRHYPLGELTAHVVGYVGSIDNRDVKLIDASGYAGTRRIGKIGIEQAYESVLHGEVGYQQVEVNARGRIVRILERTEPRAGKDVYVTIDPALQRVASRALMRKRGAVVVIDISSGGVLAFVSQPSFDTNLLVNGISHKDYAILSQSQDRPMFNRALQGQYPPGSTIKPMLALAGLEYGVRRSQDRIWCPGWFKLKGFDHKFHDWLKVGHGQVDLKRSIAESCDVYYYKLAFDLGIDRIYPFMRQFGFGAKTGIDLLSEGTGLLPSRDWKRKHRKAPWYPGETLITGIGQGYMLATPLQLAHATAILAKRGVGVRPRLVGQIEDPVAHIATEPKYNEEQLVSVIDGSHWQPVFDAMLEVVHGKRGTARKVGDGAAYRFAGKTGTSQVFSIKRDQESPDEDIDERLKDHALFVAFGPIPDPRIAIAIVVENGGSGSGAAAPIARVLFDYYLSGLIPEGDHGGSG